MKKLTIICSLIFFSTSAFAQDAESVQNLDAALKSYSTFDWVSDIEDIPSDKAFVGPEGVLIYNNESTRSMIKEAIVTNLQSKGYTQSESDADMLLGFQVLEQEADFKTYTGYETIYMGLDTVRAEDNAETVTVGPGTLIINITDKESGKVAWQGYAPGALNTETAKNEESIKSAVSEILSEFDYSAYGK
ncbi:DUF4136 domain-containing protein [Catalinimonas sp. 4WD22]|uniref:DUF4136 domain-containing protein n=1 Tax=Catalinimonas locisalis TaxID=3133978 RepID=UPI00310175D8